jgi:hypothetical protein
MPPKYYNGYRALLLENADRAAELLLQEYDSRLNARWSERAARSYALLRSDSLLGAASAWSDPARLGAVQRFEAVVSDLFESFVNKAKSVLVAERLPELPPLVTFATEPSLGPTALNSDEVQRYCAAEIDIVSQPLGYADVPMLWGVLAHETSGHCVTYAIKNLRQELIEIVAGAIKAETATRDLWQAWAEEAAADVYGLLNIGPSFALSLGAWLKMSKKTKTIGTSFQVDGDELEDKHPVDLLRLYVLKGAVEGLYDFDKYRSDWRKSITTAIDSAAQGVTNIDVYYDDPLHPRSLRLDKLAEDAQAIGRELVTAKLDCFSGRTIQEIETWDEADEDIASRVKQAAQKGVPLTVPNADDGHILAGATMALAENAALYPMLNQRLSEAFHESYMKDKVFCGWQP